MTRYCTLAYAESEFDTEGNTVEDPKLFNYILTVSKRIDKILQPGRYAKRPFFAPYIETRVLQRRDYKINSYNDTFDMDMWLFEFSQILADTTDITSKIRGYLPDYPPFARLQINDNSSDTWYSLGGSNDNGRSWPEPLKITGTWGWSDDWDNDFVDTATLNGGVNNTVTTLTVQNGEAALFSAGHLIQINSEWMEVTDTNTTLHTLTVTRGVNGSTAAAHLDTDDVAIWQIPEDVQHATATQAGLLYARRGAHDRADITEIGLIQYPPDLKRELINTLDSYRSM
jgi:hypothetical protein